MEGSPHYFDAALQNGKIYERHYGREVQQIGVVLEIYERLEREHNELADSYNDYQELLIKWQDILLTKGLIDKPALEIPLSPEEQIQKLIAVNEKQAAQINMLASRLDKLMEERYEHPELVANGQRLQPENERGSFKNSSNAGSNKSNNQGSGQHNRGNTKKRRKLG